MLSGQVSVAQGLWVSGRFRRDVRRLTGAGQGAAFTAGDAPGLAELFVAAAVDSGQQMRKRARAPPPGVLHVAGALARVCRRQCPSAIWGTRSESVSMRVMGGFA